MTGRHANTLPSCAENDQITIVEWLLLATVASGPASGNVTYPGPVEHHIQHKVSSESQEPGRNERVQHHTDTRVNFRGCASFGNLK